MKVVQVDIKIDKAVKPIFHKGRPVPYSLKEKIEVELELVVTENIFQLAEYLKWNSPDVPLKKTDWSINIC